MPEKYGSRCCPQGTKLTINPMRKNFLADIITSKTRIKLLNLFFNHPKEKFFVRQITRQIKDEINAVRRELQRFETAHIVVKEQRGNRLFYQLNPDYFLYDQLQSIVSKTSGLGYDIWRRRKQLGQLKFAFISRRLLNKEPHNPQAIDIVFIGRLVMTEVNRLIQEYQGLYQRELNYTVLTLEELKILVKKRDYFTLKLLATPRVMIVGKEKELTNALFG